jgi:hypothetical protein
MENEEDINKEEHLGEEIRMNNFSMVIAIIFVTLIMIFLFVKIMFD